jgi:hypothetical protein
MRILLCLLAFFGCAVAASAHDLWLQPSRFWTEVKKSVAVSILVGHGADRAPWACRPTACIVLKSVGPAGTADLRGGLRVQADLPGVSFGTRGTHIIALQSTHAVSELPAVGSTPTSKRKGPDARAGRPKRLPDDDGAGPRDLQPPRQGPGSGRARRARRSPRHAPGRA